MFGKANRELGIKTIPDILHLPGQISRKHEVEPTLTSHCSIIVVMDDLLIFSGESQGIQT